MINRLDSFLVKVASLEEYRRELEARRNIRKALKATAPKTRKEQQVEQLAGKQYTAGQLARGGAIGAGFGAAAGLAEGAIGGGRKGLAGAVKNPRQLMGRAVTGALFGAAVPAAKRYSDVQAAEGGWY